MKDYYGILEVAPEAGIAQIRQAYRQKAKRLHPDISPSGRLNEKAFILLVEAYEILSDPHARHEYDQQYLRHFRPEKNKFHYRTFLMERRQDSQWAVKLICFDLLHQNEEAALALFEELIDEGDFLLEQFLDREDFMDFGYLLAEELLKKGSPVRAFKLLMQILNKESQRAYFRHFMTDVYERLREIVSRKLAHDPDNLCRLSMLQQLVRCEFPPADLAYFYKQMAEIYCHAGDLQQGILFYRQAKTLDRTLRGSRRLERMLGSVA